MTDTTKLLLALALLAGNAFFVGAEFALISALRSQIEPRAETSRRARTTLVAMEQVSLMLAGAQLGITVCSLGLGAVGEPAVAHLIEPAFEAVGLPDALVHPIALVIALAIVVTLHMVLGEMVPKNIAIAGPEPSARVDHCRGGDTRGQRRARGNHRAFAPDIAQAQRHSIHA